MAYSKPPRSEDLKKAFKKFHNACVLNGDAKSLSSALEVSEMKNSLSLGGHVVDGLEGCEPIRETQLVGNQLTLDAVGFEAEN